MKKPVVAIVMGSDSDWESVKKAASTLDAFGIDYEVRVISAHRTPDLAAEYSTSLQKRGIKVLICAAGGAAHLAGVMAAHCTIPVVGIPVEGGAFKGMDALLATVQMPSGIPVATVAVGSAGATNAAILAAQILSLSSASLAKKLVAQKKELAAKVEAANMRIQQQIK